MKDDEHNYTASEPLKVDSPKYGHSIINLSTKDITYGPSIIPTIHFEPPKEENLSIQRTNQLNLCHPQSVLYLEVPCVLQHTIEMYLYSAKGCISVVL